MKATTGTKQDKLQFKKVGEVQDKVTLNVVTNKPGSLEAEAIFLTTETFTSEYIRSYEGKLFTNNHPIIIDSSYIRIGVDDSKIIGELNIKSNTNKTFSLQCEPKRKNKITVNNLAIGCHTLKLDSMFAGGGIICKIKNIIGKDIIIIPGEANTNIDNPARYDLFEVNPINIVGVIKPFNNKLSPVLILNQKYKETWISKFKEVPEGANIDNLFYNEEEYDEIFK